VEVIKENGVQDFGLGSITGILLARKSPRSNSPSPTRKGNLLVVAGWAGVVLKIDLERVEPIEKLKGVRFAQGLRTIRLTPDEETLILWGDQCSLGLFNFGDGKMVKDFKQVHE
jgi:hypothetical protein